MGEQLTNLLPPERQRVLGRAYVLRVLVVAVILATTLICAAGALLVPTYVLLHGSETAKRDQLANVESRSAPAADAALTERITALSDSTAVLLALSKTRSVSEVLRAALAVPRPGITLSGFTFSPSAGKRADTLTLSGSSIKRDALRSYQLALQQASFAQSAVLPVSAYAKDADIPFTITVTLKP